MKMRKSVEPAMKMMSEEKEKRFLDANIVLLLVNSAMFIFFIIVYTLMN